MLLLKGIVVDIDLACGAGLVVQSATSKTQ